MSKENQVDITQHKLLTEIAKDAESCGNLSKFEEQFLDTLRENLLKYGNKIYMSEKQWEVVKRIEGKVYAT